jgi:predicted permease
MGTLFRRLRHLIQRGQREDELAEEMAFHRAMIAREVEAAGRSREEAAMAARRRLGSAALAANRARDVWLWPWLVDAAQDLRFAARLIVKERQFSAAAIVALALGIGANTTAFTVLLNGLLLRPLSFDRPEALVVISELDGRGREMPPAYPDFLEWRDAARSFAGVTGEIGTAMNLSGEDRAAERVIGSYVSSGMFALLGRKPVLGRDFVADDDRPGAPPVLIIGDGVWKTRYASDPTVIGRVVRVNDVPSTIVGVMPEHFGFPAVSEVWQPLALFSGVPEATRAGRPRSATPWVYARLKPGITIEQARAELNAVSAGLARQFPATNKGVSAKVESLHERYTKDARPLMETLMAAAIFVMSIGCVNVANLLLARGMARLREIGVRASLGATRGRIVRQLLIESALLSTLAAALGLVLASYAIRLVSIASANPLGPNPYWIDWTMDWRVYAYAVAVALIATFLFGLVPALQISKTNVYDILKEGGRPGTGGQRARRWTGALMIAELALTVVLLSGAGLTLRSMLATYRAARTVDTTNLITMRLAVANQKYPTGEQRKRFYERLDERVMAIPGVTSATVASDIPFMAMSVDALVERQVAIDGHEPLPAEKPPIVSRVYVGARYFETLGVRPVRGRRFEARDGLPGQEGAIVNERFASMVFGQGNPLGRRIRLTPAAAGGAPPRAPWMTIVGVMPNVRQSVGSPDPDPVAYVPVRAEPALHRFASLIVRTGMSRPSVVPLLREAVREVDPDLPLYYIVTMDQWVAMGAPRLWVGIFGLLAAIALVLASVGLSAITAHGVAQRVQEVGVRMALGARAPQVIWLFVRRTVAHLAVGLPIGLAGAVAAQRALPAFLRGLNARDPQLFGVVSIVAVIVSIASSYFPARRAARIDPAAALRSEP